MDSIRGHPLYNPLRSMANLACCALRCSKCMILVEVNGEKLSVGNNLVAGDQEAFAQLFSRFLIPSPPRTTSDPLIYLKIVAGCPITTRCKHDKNEISTIGVICVTTDSDPAIEVWSDANHLVLQSLAETIANIITSHLATCRNLVQEKQEYISCTAHDLKTPLTTFKLCVDILSNDPNVLEEHGSVLDQATAAVEFMDQTVSNAMDLSRKQPSQLTSKPALVCVSALMGKTRHLMLGYPKQVPISFRINVGCPVEIATDESLVWRSIINLLSNACKYTLHGLITCSVSPHRLPNGALGVHISVRDTGSGIPEEIRSRLFSEPFVQASTSAPGGTGLGLFTVKRSIEMLGGSVGMGANPDSTGSVFWMIVPDLRQEEAPELHTEELSFSTADRSDSQEEQFSDEDVISERSSFIEDSLSQGDSAFPRDTGSPQTIPPSAPLPQSHITRAPAPTAKTQSGPLFSRLSVNTLDSHPQRSVSSSTIRNRRGHRHASVDSGPHGGGMGSPLHRVNCANSPRGSPTARRHSRANDTFHRSRSPMPRPRCCCEGQVSPNCPLTHRAQTMALLIEDSITTTSLLTKAFEIYGVSSYSCTSAEQGLQILKLHRFGAVVCDENFGQGLTGRGMVSQFRVWETCRPVRQYIVWASGSSSPECDAEAIKSGVDECWKKPFALSSVRALCDRIRSEL